MSTCPNECDHLAHTLAGEGIGSNPGLAEQLATAILEVMSKHHQLGYRTAKFVHALDQAEDVLAARRDEAREESERATARMWGLFLRARGQQLLPHPPAPAWGRVGITGPDSMTRRTLTLVCPMCAGEDFELRGGWFYCVTDGARGVPS